MTETLWPDTVSVAEAQAIATQLTDAVLDRLLAVPPGLEARVYEAMRYSALAPGKRLRAVMVLAGARLFGVARRSALQVAAAIEVVHAYSLIHDDLPAMDNSDLRRGRPTCHKRFDEATAVLAGDGLLTIAFEVLAQHDTHGDPAVRVELISALAAAAGAAGMVGGQMIDLIAERQPLDIGAITRLQRMKTGALIAFSCEAGAILAKASDESRVALRGYAHDLGLAFQIADDLLDIEGSAAETGKPVGADAAAGKATFVSILGVKRARAQAGLLVDQAVAYLDLFEQRADLLRQVARFVVNRRSVRSPILDKKPSHISNRTPLLDQIEVPADLRRLPESDLRQVADELRAELIDAVSITGGHFGAGLGVVELTVALHYVFDTPHDRLIWDVGHQAYPHKILTGRRDRIRTIRQGGGLSGFTKRSESEYDPFGAAHSSTSISAGLGMAVARDFKGERRNVIAVIGDGAMSAGMAYEAMNNAGSMDSRLIVILNDNDMSIAPPVGAMSAYLSRVLSSKSFLSLRHLAGEAARHLPKRLEHMARRAEELARSFVTGGTLFEELGFDYVGPIDGHNIDHLLPVLKNVRNSTETGPVLIHVVTEKGHGYLSAEQADDKWHSVAKFDVITGAQAKSSSKAPSYTSVFAKSLIKEAEKDERIVAITAAMPSGTGLNLFGDKFPKRCFDVGIAEQHAVTFAAGLAAEGMKPFATIYSTFLQRAYDQVVHDVAIQKLPVRFAIDRAGLVGNDGQTHAGSFDVTYLGCLPGFVIMAAGDEAELVHMVATCVAIDDAPSAVRFPRGDGIGVELPEQGIPLEIGRGRIMREGTTIALLNFGGRLAECLKAAQELGAYGLSTTVADARFAKPLDTDLINRLVREHEVVITIEEGAIGGFGTHVLHHLAMTGQLDHGLKIRPMVLPDLFLDHDSPNAQYDAAGLNARHIVATALAALGREIAELPARA